MLAVRQDNQDLVKAFGHRAGQGDSAISPTDVFAFPALTGVFVGVVVQALDAAHLVMEDAPISRYLPGLSPRLGRVTLRELLTNTAGLGDAARSKGESWKEALDRLDDDALVAEPGAIYSESRYSVPLAVRVIEHAVGKPFDQIARAAVLQPLGMDSSTFSLPQARSEGLVHGVERMREKVGRAKVVPAADTVGGLPVLFTTTGDVLRFLSAWMSGAIRGGGPVELPGADLPDRPGARYGGGVLVSEYRGLRLVSLPRASIGLGTSANFYVLPESRVAIFVWSVGEWPFGTASLTLQNVMDDLGAPAVKPVVEDSADSADSAHTTASLRLDPEAWAGTYRNGNQIFVLRDSLSALVLFNGRRNLKLKVTPDSSATVVAHGKHRHVTLGFDLRTEGDGHRCVYYQNRAFGKESVEGVPLPLKGRALVHIVKAPVPGQFTMYEVDPRVLNRREVVQAMRRDDPGGAGRVVVWLHIDRYGAVSRFEVRKSSGRQLDRAARAVAGVYRFSPARFRGEAVPVWVQIPINFTVPY